MAQSVERHLGKVEVVGSIPTDGLRFYKNILNQHLITLVVYCFDSMLQGFFGLYIINGVGEPPIIKLPHKITGGFT